jgi:hypothetical protein
MTTTGLRERSSVLQIIFRRRGKMSTLVDDLLRRSAFVIAYDKKGDPIDVAAGDGHIISESGNGPIPTDLIDRVKNHLNLTEVPDKEGFPIEVKTTSILHVGSQSCYVVLLGGSWRRICTP